jgi:hypothetical protein
MQLILISPEARRTRRTPWSRRPGRRGQGPRNRSPRVCPIPSTLPGLAKPCLCTGAALGSTETPLHRRPPPGKLADQRCFLRQREPCQRTRAIALACRQRRAVVGAECWFPCQATPGLHTGAAALIDGLRRHGRSPCGPDLRCRSRRSGARERDDTQRVRERSSRARAARAAPTQGPERAADLVSAGRPRPG